MYTRIPEPVNAEQEGQDAAARIQPTGRGHAATGASFGLAIRPVIARRALAVIAARVSASRALGLNWMNSVPASRRARAPG